MSLNRTAKDLFSKRGRMNGGPALSSPVVALDRMKTFRLRVTHAIASWPPLRDEFRLPAERGQEGQGGTGIELGESTALFSLSSDGGGGEGRGEESRFFWISPLPNPLPARSSQGEGDRRPAFQCLIEWQCTLSPSPFQGEREFTTESRCGLRTSQ